MAYSAYMERMVSTASQTSGVKAWERCMAHAAEHYDITRRHAGQDILCPSIVNPNRARVQPWRSHHATTPCQTWWPSAVCTGLSPGQWVRCSVIWRSNVKRRIFGYALNFFHPKLNSFDNFFRFLQYCLHSALLTITVLTDFAVYVQYSSSCY